jgi:hypothetical protein
MAAVPSPPLTPHASGTQSAAMPAISSATAPSMKNLPETNSNSNQFAEGGIYKFFFKTVEERNEWMSKFRKVAGMAVVAAPAPFAMPTATSSAATLSPSAGDQSPKKCTRARTPSAVCTAADNSLLACVCHVQRSRRW